MYVYMYSLFLCADQVSEFVKVRKSIYVRVTVEICQEENKGMATD